MNKTIGVIGATGQVGQELLKILTHQDVDICAFVRDENKLSQKKRIETRVIDLKNPNLSVFENIQILFWITPYNLDSSSEEKWLDILKNSSINHIVQLSSVHPEVFNLHKSEILIKQTDIPYTIMRSNTFMQNFNYEKSSIINRQAFYFPAGQGKISFIDIRDIAQAAANILIDMNPTNQIYTLTGSVALDYYQIASIFSDVCRKPIKYIDTYASPEFETEENQKNQIRQDFFKAVRNNLFSEVNGDLEKIISRKARSFQQYVKDYWSPLA